MLSVCHDQSTSLELQIEPLQTLTEDEDNWVTPSTSVGNLITSQFELWWTYSTLASYEPQKKFELPFLEILQRIYYIYIVGSCLLSFSLWFNLSCAVSCIFMLLVHFH